MGDPFKASDVQFHRDTALSYEHKANAGTGDPAINAQLAQVHATLAVAATNIALYELYQSSNVAQRIRLAEIETAIAELVKAMPPR